MEAEARSVEASEREQSGRVLLTCLFLMLTSAAIFSAAADAVRYCLADGGSSRGKGDDAAFPADMAVAERERETDTLQSCQLIQRCAEHTAFAVKPRVQDERRQ